MNKQQLIETLATKTTTTKTEVETFLNALVSTVRTEVKKGNNVKIIGFGTFMKAKRKARTGRNPQTGATLKLPAKWYPKFRAGSEFKTTVSN